ncbi:MAG: hypothetical protein A2014_09160 [Spirochaetes bacterium GWF1_49_6]|nr:MAG: hypothetical protein A2014_09160 [Spirochaetes bacterium GWF1_49_6]
MNKEKKAKNPFLRILKWFIIIFVIIAAAAAGTIAYFYYTTDPQDLVKKISAEIQTNYNREIRVQTIEISLLQGIRFTGIEVSKSGGFVNGVSVKFAEGSLVYNPLALFLRQLDVLSISVSGLTTTYDNIMNILNDFTKDVPKPTAQTNHQAKLFTIKVRNIEIKDSQVLLNDIPLNFHATLSPSELFDESGFVLDVDSMYGSVHYDGTLSKGYLQIRSFQPDKLLKMNTGFTIPQLDAELVRGGMDDITVTGKIVNICWGEFNLCSQTQFTGTYSLKKQYLLVHGLGFRVNNSRFYISRLLLYFSRVHVDLVADKIDLDVSDFSHDMSGKLTGNIDIVYDKSFILSGKLNLDNFKYRWIDSMSGEWTVTDNRLTGSANADFAGGSAKLGFSSGNLAGSPWSVEFNSQKIDVARFLAEWDKYSVKGGGNEGGGNGGDGIGLPIKMPVIDLRANIGQIVFDDVDLREVSIAGVWKNSELTADGSLQFLRGKLSAHLVWKGNVVSGKFQYADGKLKELADAFLKGTGKLHGNLNASGTFALDLTDIFGSDADFTVTASGGEIRDFAVQKEMASALYDIPVDDIFFDTVLLKAALADKKLTIETFKFDSDAITIGASGNIVTDTKKMNIDAEASFSQDFLNPLPNIATIFTSGYQKDGRIVFKLKIGGAFDKPDVKLK